MEVRLGGALAVNDLDRAKLAVQGSELQEKHSKLVDAYCTSALRTPYAKVSAEAHTGACTSTVYGSMHTGCELIDRGMIGLLHTVRLSNPSNVLLSWGSIPLGLYN